MTPVDVVKTRIQLDPATYNQGFIGGFRQIAAAEGAGALLTGLMPTAQGYFIQAPIPSPLCSCSDTLSPSLPSAAALA